MSKELRVLAWCDPCASDGLQESGETYTLELHPAMKGPREIELCDTHAAAYGLPQLVASLDKYGRAPSSPVKGSLARPAARAAQSATGAKLVAAAATGVRHGKPPAGKRDLACPDCELTYASASGLRGHVWKIHGKRLDAGQLAAIRADAAR